MEVISFSQAKNNLETAFDSIGGDADCLVITRRDAPNTVLMSIDYYRGLTETLYLLKSSKNSAHLESSINDAKKGISDSEFFLMGRKLAWTEAGWSDYMYWQGQDKKSLKRINMLLAETLKTPCTGVGKPEMLRDTLSGFWSRRIDEMHRLLYAVDRRCIVIVACRYHYKDIANDLIAKGL